MPVSQSFISLSQNAALLVALSSLYGLLMRFRIQNKLLSKILIGILFGLIAIVAMLMPLEYQSGILFDGRSVVLLLCGLFGGGVEIAIATTLASVFRIYLGGIGTIPGIIIIIGSAAVGLIANRIFTQKPEELHLLKLWMIAFVAHIFVLLSLLLLPSSAGINAIQNIWLPFLTIFPVATVLIGILFQTEKRRLNDFERIKLSENRYENLSKNSPSGIFRTDPTGNTTYVNPKWCQITGLSVDDALGYGWLKAVHPEDKEKLMREWYIAVNDNKKSTAEYRCIKKNGQTVWVYGEAVAEYSDQGIITAYVGTITDITKRKIAEQALRENEANYRSLFENDSAIKLMIDPESGQIVNANKAASQFYGWTVEKLKSMNIGQITVAERAKNASPKSQHAEQEAANFTEAHHRIANGQVKNVELYTSRIRFNEKECFHSIIHNVTENKQAEEKLKLLSKAIEQSPVGILITDQSGKIEYVNPKLSEITGYTSTEIIGEELSVLNLKAYPPDFITKVKQTITSGKDWIGEICTKKKNGESYWESLIISPILNENGKIVNYINIREDISSQKKLIRDLIKAKEKAEKGEQLKSAFLANMSHEIRTPLNAILGFANMMTTKKPLPESSLHQYSFIINKSAEGLLQTFDDILDISMLESGQIEILKEPFPIHSKLYKLKVQFEKKLTDIEKSNIAINIVNCDPKLMLMNDEVRFIQIFSKLLDNAIKFTEEGQIEYGISGSSDGRIEFFVSDTGIGISKTDQKIIFERFRQVGKQPKIIHSGNGLGLAIVKGLVELMEGTFRLESEIGKGTTFRFELPSDEEAKNRLLQSCLSDSEIALVNH